MASISGVQKSVGVKDISTRITVPPNDVARVMYYLNCVLTSCGLDIVQDDLVDFRNYHRLTTSRQNYVFLAAFKYSPDELSGKTIFLDDDDSVCGENENVFLEISQDMKLFHAQQNVLIVGEQRKVNKIMVFKESWLEKFYGEPMKRNIERIKSAMSNHCAHCAGKSGKCVCSKCPRTAESQCSPTIHLTEVVDAFRASLDEALEESQNARFRHCVHCKGLEATCGCEEGCSKPANSKCITVHKTVLCDGCRTSQIVGVRYKCGNCNDYDLCQDCYWGNKHELTHSFVKIDHVGSTGIRLEPRMKPRPKISSPPSLEAKDIGGFSSERKGFFYENMSIAEMKSYLTKNGVPCSDVFEKDELCRKVWECHCDSVSVAELSETLKDTGVDISGYPSIAARRAAAKAAFRKKVYTTNTGVSQFEKDSSVILCGLKTAGLNGMKGKVVDGNVEGRVEVVLDGSGRVVRVKAENLKHGVEIID